MRERYFATAGIIISLFSVATANAFETRFHDATLRVTGYGNVGIIEPDFDKPDFLGDWDVRAQLNYSPTARHTLGLVYALDAQSVDSDEYIEDLFVLWQARDFGRIEFGFTDSIASKLGLGLPDVGGMRVNDNPLFYKKINPDGPIIADGAVDSGDGALRINFATNVHNGAQYGISIAGLTDDFDYAIDAGAKFRMPRGKVKTAIALGASFIDSPDNFQADPYAPNLTADWRAQASAGLNVQYNSWIWAINARAVYDYNAISRAADGISAGTGVSYDVLNYSLSLSYIISDTGIWHSDANDYFDNTVIASFRYKYSQNVDGWTSVGVSSHTPFLGAGLRITF